MKINDFIEEIQRNGKYESYDEAKNALYSVIQSIKDNIIKDEIVTISGFGSFKKVLVKGRTGFIPNSNKKYKSENKFSPKFIASKKFKEEIK